MLETTEDGIIAPGVELQLDWTLVSTEPGDVVIFSSYVPHRSRPNRSDRRRALIYLTYNAQAEGYLRDEYYRHKRANIKSGRLSMINHFQGTALATPSAGALAAGAPAAGACAAAASWEAIDQLRRLFALNGGKMYDPIVTQLEHALQGAALAEAAGAPDALIAAALLHDVGHLLLDEHMGNGDFLLEDRRHEELGADFLQNLSFPQSVVEPIRLHVPAKRYLCASDGAYWDGLSSASQRSLDVQGGAFSDAEAASFIARPHAPSAADVRRWDDRAKGAGVATPQLEHFLTGAVSRVLVAATQ